jgi:hypothetical protein
VRIKKETVEVGVVALVLSLMGVSAIANADFNNLSEQAQQTTAFENSKEEATASRIFRAEVRSDSALAVPEVKISPAVESSKHFYEHEMIEVLLGVGFEGQALRTAWAVAMKESTGNPLAHNGNSSTGDNSYGLFQINMTGKLGAARMEKYGLSEYDDLFDPYVNARIAFQMSSEGTNWGAWGIGANAYNGSTEGSFHKWYKEYPRGE